MIGRQRGYDSMEVKGAPALLFFLALAATVWFFGLIADAVFADYNYSNSIGSYWELGVKASTLEKKADYLDKFVGALEKGDLADSSALWLKTPDNSTEQNFVALRSLQRRMHEIQAMDVKSFEYQQAMAQITGQEQDEAKNMLGVFREAWFMSHHFFLWDWISFIGMLALAVVFWILFGALVSD
jgi:hypothetical protein